MAERALERTAERGGLGAVEVQALDHDRGSRLELGEHALDVRGARERHRPPRKVDRVVGDLELRPLLDEPEGGKAQPRLADEPLDLPLGEQVVEPPGWSPCDQRAAGAPSTRTRNSAAPTGSMQRASARPR